jgi:membrane protease subunit HflK
MEGLDTNAFLQEVQPDSQSQFLTGDKNILNLQINVQYRISESGIYQYYFGTTRPDQRLRLLVESAASDLISRSGVDFVHPLGLAELRAELTQSTRALVEQYHLGVEVEDVTIVSVYPPVRVKAQFLDVLNARADKETYINTALGYAQQRASEARAEEQRIRDESETYRQQTIEVARSEAYRFNKMVERLHLDEQAGIQSYSEARQMALHRYYMEVLNSAMRKVAGKVFLDSGEPVDLTIFRDPQE